MIVEAGSRPEPEGQDSDVRTGPGIQSLDVCCSPRCPRRSNASLATHAHGTHVPALIRCQTPSTSIKFPVHLFVGTAHRTQIGVCDDTHALRQPSYHSSPLPNWHTQHALFLYICPLLSELAPLPLPLLWKKVARAHRHCAARARLRAPWRWAWNP